MANMTLEQWNRAMRRYPRLMKREIVAELYDSGGTITSNARSRHNFRTHSGALERSIQFDVDSQNMILTVFMDDRMTTTSSGKSYGVFQHEGTFDGYKKSPMSPSFSSSSGSRGIQADHFLWTPYKSEIPKLVKRLEKVPEKVERVAFR